MQGGMINMNKQHEQERKFTLDGWQWRKYKTRNGMDAKIDVINFKSEAKRITIIGRITQENGSEMVATWKNNGAWQYDESEEGHDFDLFDVPDQKEPETRFINVFKDKGKNDCQDDLSTSYPHTNQKEADKLSKYELDKRVSRIKIYLEENRWDE